MQLSNYINFKALKNAFKTYKDVEPFDHCICDNFFTKKFARSLYKEFPTYKTKEFWHEYNNPIEIKKTCNNWNKFKKNTYLAFTLLCSHEFIKILSELSQIKKLEPDHGLNGGGLHIHKSGGKLNHHLDYDIHPKIDKQRKLNALIYLTPNWKNKFGGDLGFFSHNKKDNQPGELIKKITPIFNRAVFFDTTQNSWHGLINKVKVTNGITRNSLAIYYLKSPSKNISKRTKALFAPTKNQKNNIRIIKLIKKRSDINKFNTQYKINN